MAEPVYKVLSEAAFEEAWAAGRFHGLADDARDGFIHLSAGHQLAATLAAHFAAHEGLVLVALDADRLGQALRWEASRGGALFPHLYASIDLAAMLWVEPLPLGPDGRHLLPEGVFA